MTVLACALLLTAAGCQKKAEDVKPAPAPAAEAAASAEAAAPADAAAAAAPAEAAAPAAPAAEAAKVGDVAPEALAVPANAIKTESGLQYVKNKTNDAGAAITATDTVLVNYTGWTTDGKMFDSSINRGEPAVFPVSNLIPGFIEALTITKVGESVRVWIPEDLAYKGQEGAPAGTLVFDLEVLDNLTPVMPPKDVPEDAIKLENGVAYRVVKTTPGAAQVLEKDVVTLNFAGWTQSEGRMFHSSRIEGEPLVAPADAFFPGWKSILPLVHVGDVFQCWIPQELGIAPQGGDGMDGTLIFEVSVDNVIKLPDTPADVAAAPEDAEKTASGLASKVIKAGTGTVHPTANSVVSVNYTGWTTDGQMFDSSYIHGDAAMLPLGQVIPGWTEGVQLMVEGETRRMWIPEDLAYKGQPGAPAGMLVFDVELVKILGEMPPQAMPEIPVDVVDASRIVAMSFCEPRS